MANWAKVDPAEWLPEVISRNARELNDLVTEGLTGATQGIAQIPSLLKIDVVETAGKFAKEGAASAVINAVLDTIKAALDGASAHVLLVPIARTYPADTGRSFEVPSTLRALESVFDVDLKIKDQKISNAYAALAAGNGGNSGFYRTVAAAMLNAADPNRPPFDAASDGVVMAILLAGASRYSDIIGAASLIEQNVVRAYDASTTGGTVPVPQNVTVKPVVTKNGAVGVRIDWDPPSEQFGSPYFPGLSTAVSRYAVIRSTDPRARSAASVLDLFATQVLTEGLVHGNSKVIAVKTGRGAAYLDTDKLDPGVPVYYCVAWELIVKEPDGSRTLKFDRISIVLKADLSAATVPAQGAASNWYATPRALGAFPKLDDVTTRMLERARVLTKRAGSPITRLNRAIDALNAGVAAESKEASTVIDTVERLVASLGRTPVPSLYGTLIHGVGGNAYLLAELSRLLSDTEEEDRPPFDGGEYVCGVCIVAGAPRLADLQKTIDFFEMLFGSSQADNPLTGLLGAIDTSVTQAEAALFDPAMQPFKSKRATTDAATAAATGATVIDPITGKAPTAPRPVTANSGKSVATDSPENPNAGDTNVIPTSELC